MAPAGQGQLWSDVLCCSVCNEVFSRKRLPTSLMCGHVVCSFCLPTLVDRQCIIDETIGEIPFEEYPPNSALVFIACDGLIMECLPSWCKHGQASKALLVNIENSLRKMASCLRKADSERGGTVFSEVLSRTLIRKLVSFLCFQIVEEEGRAKALKTGRAIADRIMTEVLLSQQVPAHLSTQLWTAVRARGCQFLGPAMQEDVLKLILLALGGGAAIARKTLVMYVVQMLAEDYPQVSKTCVGHVVQLLYRASCFHVLKREGESSLMQLKEEFREYEALRKEHDAQIVQMALEVGLRICPDQWSALLYGDQQHRSHMQSIIDKTQSPQSYEDAMEELNSMAAKGDDLAAAMIPYLFKFRDVHPTHQERVSWSCFADFISALESLVDLHVKYSWKKSEKRPRELNGNHLGMTWKVRPVDRGGPRYKTKMCRDHVMGHCPRGARCTWAHSEQEMEDARRGTNTNTIVVNSNSAFVPSGVTAAAIPQTAIQPRFAPTLPPNPQAPVLHSNNEVVSMMPVMVSPPTHPGMQHVVMVQHPPQNMMLSHPPPPPPPGGGPHPIWHPSSHQQTVLIPHNSPPIHGAPTFWMHPTNPAMFSLDGISFEESSTWLQAPTESREQDADQLHMKRKEILSRLAPLTAADDEECEHDGGIGHVSYTVASSVLDDRGELHPLIVMGGPPPLELPPIPANFGPVLPNTSTEDAIIIMGDIASMQQPRTRAPSVPVIQTTTILTACPGSLLSSEAAPTATVQADCTMMQVKDTLCQPLPTPHIQLSVTSVTGVPLMAADSMEPCTMLPIAVPMPVAVPPVPVPVLSAVIRQDPQDVVSNTLDRIVGVKERLNEAEGTPMSCAVSQQLRVELEIAEREMHSLDRRTQTSCLLKELEQVDRQIEIIESRAAETC